MGAQHKLLRSFGRRAEHTQTHYSEFVLCEVEKPGTQRGRSTGEGAMHKQLPTM